MKVYTVSYFANGEREATDGVYGAYSLFSSALSAIEYFARMFEEDIIDFDSDYTTSRIYTTKGMYLIETFNLDEDYSNDEDW